MTREIKFRAWDKKGKTTLSPRELNFGGMYLNLFLGRIVTINYSPNVEEAEDVENDLIPLQYTDLKDKNGKEIYEGDCFRLAQNTIGTVKYVNEYGAFMVEYLGNKLNSLVKDFNFAMPDDNAVLEANELEIIGNIYENPKLLK